jgi:antitoxin component YwqK of YwqJK toxin-antitoxin module
MFRRGTTQLKHLLIAILIVTPAVPHAQIFRGYYSDGALKFESHRKRRRRVIRGYYPDGTLQFVATYKDGELDGPVKEYYPNGVLKAEIRYEDNERDGLAKFYYENGMLMGKIYYKRGRETGKAKYYDQNGRLTATGPSGDIPHGSSRDSGEVIRNLEAGLDSSGSREGEQ